MNVCIKVLVFCLFIFSMKAEDPLVFSAKFSEDYVKGINYKYNKIKGFFIRTPTIDSATKALRVNRDNFLNLTAYNTSKLPTDNFTVTTWVRHDNENTGNIVGCFFREEKKNDGWFIGNDKNNFRFGFGNKSERHFKLYNFGKLEDFGKWRHIAFSYTSEEAKVYINGRLIKVVPGIGPLRYKNKFTRLAIGSYLSRGEDVRMDGLINQVNIYSKVLNRADIYKDYLKSSFRDARDKDLYTHGSWSFSSKNISEKTVKGSNSKHPMTIHGDVTVSKNRSLKIANGQYLSVKDAEGESLPSESLSLSAWVKINLKTKSGIISTLDPKARTGWAFYADENLKLKLDAFGTSGEIKLASSKALTLGQWHHVACRLDGKKASLYLDGRRVAGETYKGLFKYNSSNKLIAAAMQNEDKSYSSINGEIAEVIITEKNYLKYFPTIYKKYRNYFAKFNTVIKEEKLEFSQGLYYSQFNTQLKKLDEVFSAKASETTQASTLKLNDSALAKESFVEFFTYIKIEEESIYTLAVEGAKQAQVYLGKRKVVDPSSGPEALELDSGYYPITVIAQASKENKELTLSLKAVNGEASPLTDQDFFILEGFTRYPHKVDVKETVPDAIKDKNLVNELSDNDPETFFWFKGVTKGQYITLTLPSATPLESIQCLIGKSDLNDPVKNAALQISTDGKTFKSLAFFTGKEEINAELNNQKVQTIRIFFNGPTPHWQAIREIIFKGSSLEKMPLN